MRAVLTAEQMRAAEQPHLDAGEDLMSEAAFHVEQQARTMLPAGEPATVLVVAGPGNNGGDGLFAAAGLAGDFEVLVWQVADQVHPEGLSAATEAGCHLVDAKRATAELLTVDLVIDAAFGIGGRPGLDEDLADFAETCEVLGIAILSIDLPSGLDADSGALHRSFVTTTTITFEAYKWAHVLPPAADRCGEVVVADLALDVEADHHLVELDDFADAWPVPDHTSDKYSRGVVGLDTGSATYPGAAVLGCLGALCSGAGMVRYVGQADPAAIMVHAPSVVTADGRVQAMVVGSGWGDLDDARDRLRAAVERGVPLVLDADAIALAPDVNLPENSLLTPHAGELARLLGVERAAVQADPIAHARRAGRDLGAAVLLKGATQFVVTPDEVLIAIPGPAWTAQAGSGDVLAGVCGTLLAAGLPAADAAALAASLQSATAAVHRGPVPPDELARRLPRVLSSLVQA